ncbi:MAG: PqiC family protein [Nitrospirota bacterium]|nr:PqiC family protein [Nitrospirota bacterium]
MNLLGCGTSQPSHFYLLQALPPDSTSDISERKSSSLSLGLGPLTLPHYLNRPKIVTQTGVHEVELAQFHKWAEPLSENMSNVMAENLSALLSTDRVVQFPWRRSVSIDYQLVMNVIQCDGMKNEEVILKVRWTLIREDGETLLEYKTSHITEPVAGPDYEDFVQAMSRALASFSQEIAEAIKAQGPPRKKNL